MQGDGAMSTSSDQETAQCLSLLVKGEQFDLLRKFNEAGVPVFSRVLLLFTPRLGGKFMAGRIHCEFCGFFVFAQ